MQNLYLLDKASFINGTPLRDNPEILVKHEAI